MHHTANTILLVEDHPLVLDVIGATIRTKFPHCVIKPCSNASEARKNLKNGLHPNLAVVDINLPDGDGVDLIGEMHLQYSIPVVVYSGQTDRFVIKACIKKGAFAFVSKSSTADQLCLAINKVISGEKFFPPSSMFKHSWENDMTETLTERQKDVLDLLLKARSNQEIAGKLGLAAGTIRNHVSILLSKFCATNRHELAYKAQHRRYERQEN